MSLSGTSAFPDCNIQQSRFIRIRKDAPVAGGNRLVQVKQLFDDLKHDTARRIGHRRAVHGVRLWLTGMKVKDDYLVIASNRDDMKALDYYRNAGASKPCLPG